MSPTRDPERSFEVLLHHQAVRALSAAAGGVAHHLVGGVLRDRCLGLRSRDLDAVVERDGEAIARRLAGRLGARYVHLGGKAFGAYRVIGDAAGRSFVLDLWDREGGSLAADLARRDFTVNAIAIALPGGGLVDPHDGLGDIRRRVLRATTPQSFTGDPLRVLRLPRLLAQLPGFTAEPETLALARAAAPRLAEVASERVRDELSLLFSQPDAARAVAVLGALDVYPGLWLGRPGEPEARTGGAPAGELGRLCGELSRLGERAQRLRELAAGRLGDWGLRVEHRLARLALAFAHVPPSGEEEAGAVAALVRTTEAGYVSRKDAQAVARLLPGDLLPEEPARQRWLLHRLGELWPTAVCYAGARAGAHGGEAVIARWEGAAADLVALYREAGPEILDPAKLVDGAEAGRILGTGPGPEVGRALAVLRRAQVEGTVTTREEAKALLRDFSGTSRSSSLRPASAG